MQSYVYLITISAFVFLCWLAVELLGRPIRILLVLRSKVFEQMLVLGNLSLPKPRETAVSSRDIREYDRAVGNMREAQRTFHDLGSQLLAFSENEPAVCTTIGFFGLNVIAAGRALINLSEVYSRSHADRVGLRQRIENFLCLGDAALARCPRRDKLTEFQTKSMHLRDIGLST